MPHVCAHWWRLSGNSSALWEGSSNIAAHLGLMHADASCQAHTFLCGNTTTLCPRTWAPSSPFVRLSTNCCGSSLSRPSCHSSCHMRYPLSHSGSYGATTCSVAGRLHGGCRPTQRHSCAVGHDLLPQRLCSYCSQKDMQQPYNVFLPWAPYTHPAASHESRLSYQGSRWTVTGSRSSTQPAAMFCWAMLVRSRS